MILYKEMDFIASNGSIDLKMIDARDYSNFHGNFIEQMDPYLAQIILDDTSTITTKTNDGNVIIKPRFTDESKLKLRNMMNRIKNGDKLEILYSQKFGLGRHYSHNKSSMGFDGCR